MYLNGATQATGEYLVQALLSQLIELDALPVKIDCVNPWWAIGASVDWLREHADPHLVFNRMVPFPDPSSNGIYAEVLLTAFAHAVVTCSSGVTKWISGDARKTPLPKSIRAMVSEAAKGRMIAFKMSL